MEIYFETSIDTHELAKRIGEEMSEEDALALVQDIEARYLGLGFVGKLYRWSRASLLYEGTDGARVIADINKEELL